TRELGIEQTHIAGGDKLIGGTSKLEVGVQGATLQCGTSGHVDAQRGKKCLQVLCGHVLRVDLDVQHGGVGGNFVCAGEMGRGVPNFQGGRLEDTGVFPQVILGVEIDVYGGGRGRASRNEQSFGKFRGAIYMGLAVLRSEVGIEVEQAAESSGRIKESSRGEVQTLDGELSVDRRERGVLLIQRTSFAVELEAAAARKICGKGHREVGGWENVGGRQIDVVIDSALLGVGGADVDAAILEGQLFHGELVA